MNVRKYVVEFIGTFFLVLTIGCSVLVAGNMAPVAIAASLIAMIFAGGYISGAHYNPAVTLAVFMRGKCPAADVIPYIAAQLAAAVAAAVVVLFLKGDAPVEAIKIVVARALVAELMYTFALAFVVLNVATAKGTSGNSFYGLAIGFTVLAGAYAVGGMSGGAFNPAVAVGLTVLGKFKAANIWIYLVANFGGAALAALVFNFLNTDE